MHASRRLTWLGHGSVLLELDGTRLLVDPVLRERFVHLRRRVPAPPDPGHVDAVLITHVHHDHLDKASLRALVRQGADTIVVPRGARSLVRSLGFRRILEVLEGDEIDLGGRSVTAVPAWHQAQRLPGTPWIPSLGFVADGVWVAGDTDLDPGMADHRGTVDVAVVPIAGWGPKTGDGHMDATEAARAVELVRPAVAIPIHWGTYTPVGMAGRLSHLIDTPGPRFAEEVALLAPDVDVRVLAVGHATAL